MASHFFSLPRPKRPLLAAGVFLSLTVFGNSRAEADKVANFKHARGKVGCNLIPYPQLAAECRGAQQRVTKWCKTKAIACKPTMKKPILNEHLRNGQSCVSSRRAVATVFERAKKKLNAETAKNIFPIADELIREIESQEEGHQHVIDGYLTAVRKCEELLH